MFTKTLSKIASLIPSSIKYKMSKIRPIYTFVMRLGQPIIRIQTAAGKINWKIDRLTAQEFVLGTYELYMQRAFLTFVHPGDVVYDVGANAGFHSFFCGLLVGPSGQVIAYEPNPENCASIERQIMVNPDIPVSILSYALSDHCGRVGLDTSRGSRQCYVTETGNISIEARTLDSLVTESRIPPPKCIKIDVEGHEEHVIKGSLETVQSYKPVILCDYNDSTTLPKVAGLLMPLGYTIKQGPPIIALPSNSFYEVKISYKEN